VREEKYRILDEKCPRRRVATVREEAERLANGGRTVARRAAP